MAVEFAISNLDICLMCEPIGNSSDQGWQKSIK